MDVWCMDQPENHTSRCSTRYRIKLFAFALELFAHHQLRAFKRRPMNRLCTLEGRNWQLNLPYSYMHINQTQHSNTLSITNSPINLQTNRMRSHLLGFASITLSKILILILNKLLIVTLYPYLLG